MKFTNFIQLALLGSVIMFTAPSCVKEGPMGLQGEPGTDGTAGTDANETCKMCHTASSVDLIATQFEFSKHSYGEAAFEESGNTGCTPCHAQEAFKYVVKNNVPATFVLNAGTGKYVNQYATVATAAYGEIGCSTCHSSLHTTYGASDLALTTVAPVQMTMLGGLKSIDLPADDHKSNLCVKCHQPRPFTNALTGNVLDYNALATTTGVVYDGDPAGKTNIIKPSYRTHTHYGTAGAVYAGMGGVEFPGMAYTNSAHTTVASCIDCHMGAKAGKSDVVGRAG
ncbi:MAG: ammonia-forming cytochrome c nitrite reductase subunit c552, partial [Bacteroidales bacterium]